MDDIKKVEYKVVNGISFHVNTPDKVCEILSNHCGDRKTHIRVFYGDTKTGRDWCEVYDTIGYVGRSMGTHKIPLLIKTSKSLCGGAILDNCIVKITINKRVAYQHPNYYCPIEVIDNKVWNTEKNECVFDGKSERAAKREYEFLKGIYNSHDYRE